MYKLLKRIEKPFHILSWIILISEVFAGIILSLAPADFCFLCLLNLWTVISYPQDVFNGTSLRLELKVSFLVYSKCDPWTNSICFS